MLLFILHILNLHSILWLHVAMKDGFFQTQHFSPSKSHSWHVFLKVRGHSPGVNAGGWGWNNPVNFKTNTFFLKASIPLPAGEIHWSILLTVQNHQHISLIPKGNMHSSSEDSMAFADRSDSPPHFPGLSTVRLKCHWTHYYILALSDKSTCKKALPV